MGEGQRKPLARNVSGLLSKCSAARRKGTVKSNTSGPWWTASGFVIVAILVSVCLVGVIAPTVRTAEAQEPAFRISEFMAANPGPVVDDDGETSDWIEIQNISPNASSRVGWTLRDSSNTWRFPDLTVASGDFVIVWASGEDRDDPGAELHSSFKLTSGGEYLALRSPGGANSTEFSPSYPEQSSGVSYGFDAQGDVGFLALSTPGQANSALGQPVAEAPVATIGNSFQSAAFSEQLTTTTPDAVIRFTVDGNVPTNDSAVAVGGSVTIVPDNPVTTMRAVAFADGHKASPVSTFTYIHADAAAGSVGGGAEVSAGIESLSVVSISTASGSDPADAESYEPARIDYVDLNGAGFSEEAAMKPSGYSSFRSSPKKTFRVNFSSSYGASELDYPLFADKGNDYFVPGTRFDQLELRGYSLDGYFGGDPGLYLSNEFARSLTLDLGSLNSHGRAVNLFVDGSYRGLYQLRERINADWMSEYLGGDGGDYESWFIDDVLRTEDLNDGTGEVFAAIDAATSYQEIKHLIDADSLINSSLALWFYAGYTEKEWRVLGPSDPDHPGGMHFIPNDLDLAFGTRYDAGRSDSMRDYLNRFDDDPEFEQILWDHAALAFCDGGEMTVARMLERFDELVAEIVLAMPAEVAAWNWGSVASWNQSMVLARNRVISGQSTTEGEWTSKGWLVGCNRAPEISAPRETLALAGQRVEFSIEAADPDGDAVTFSATDLPPGLTIASLTGSISGVPTTAGAFTSFVRATDSSGRWLESPITWRILSAAEVAAPFQLNELNYVDNSGSWAGADPAFPGSGDNGGDWFELLVLEDDTDLRGWSVELWDRDRTTRRYKQVEVFTFSQIDVLAALPAGLVVTVSEDVAEDTEFDLHDDWHINATASSELAGALLAPEGRSNFDTSAAGIQVLIRAPDGSAAGVLAGLSRSWINYNEELGSDEILTTCADSPISNPVISYVPEAVTSTFGRANRCGQTLQDLSGLRDVVPPGDTNCDDTTTDADAQAVLDFAVGLRVAVSACPLTNPETELDSRGADFNGDSRIDLLDALLITQS